MVPAQENYSAGHTLRAATLKSTTIHSRRMHVARAMNEKRRGQTEQKSDVSGQLNGVGREQGVEYGIVVDAINRRALKIRR